MGVVKMARPRAHLPVDTMPLVGGDLCLDFVNTTGARTSGAPRERLTDYDDLLVWSERVGLLSQQVSGRLRRRAARQPAAAARALARARKLREDMYQLLAELAAGRPAVEASLAPFAEHWRAARDHQQLLAVGDRFVLRINSRDTDLERMCTPIVLAAADLLTSERASLLRRCAECDWLFLDESKNGTRRWCKAMCGNRARSRERYMRRRSEE